jgi:hypothetical protein
MSRFVRVCKLTPELPFEGFASAKVKVVGAQRSHLYYLRRPWAQFHKTWQWWVGWPWNCCRGVHFGVVKFGKGQGHWGQR